MTASIWTPSNILGVPLLATFRYIATLNQTDFPVDPYSPSAANIIVSVNGIELSPTAVGVDGTNVITTPRSVGQEVVIRVFLQEVTGGLDASSVLYKSGGLNSVIRQLNLRLDDVGSVKNFGVKGDGVTYESTKIQKAVDAMAGGNLFWPPGVYIIDSTFNVPSNSYWFAIPGTVWLKLASRVWSPSNGWFFEFVEKENLRMFGLGFDGNKGNVGPNRSPSIVLYKSKGLVVQQCQFTKNEGICFNLSTGIENVDILENKFIENGGNPNNSDGYRWQAIAFSESLGLLSKNVSVRGNYFYKQGLDCCSINAVEGATISDNVTEDSYTLFYNAPGTNISRNVVIAGNRTYRTSEFGAATAVPPGVFDCPKITGLTIVGNIITGCDSAAIGIFDDTQNFNVSSNTIVDPMGASGVFGAAITLAAGIKNGSVKNNTLVDTRGTPLMNYGITIKTDTASVDISDNIIINPLTGRIGYFSAAIPTIGLISTFTSNTQLASTVRVSDTDLSSGIETVYGRTLMKFSGSSPALTIEQAGTGAPLRLIPKAAPTTFAEGDIYYDSTTKKHRGRNDVGWFDFY